MTSDEWDAIARRLEGAWPPFPQDRREVYLEVLADVPAHKVGGAVDALLREDREQLPPPGTIRQRALGAQPQPVRDVVTSGASPRATIAGPPPPPPPPPASGRSIGGGPLLAAMAGKPTSDAEFESLDGSQELVEGTSGMATAALVLGIVGLLVVPFVCSVLAIIFGAIALDQTKKNPRLGGREMAHWGFWLGIASIVLWTLVIIVAVSQDDSSGSYALGQALTRLLLG